MPKAMDGIRPMLIYPLGGILLIGILMCAINPLMGAINTGISWVLNSMGGSSKILLGCVLGGMMSVDMGGPINKAAYVFGTAALSMGQFDVMAAVMIGGMVPPIAIALSCILGVVLTIVLPCILGIILAIVLPRLLGSSLIFCIFI